MYLRFKTDDSVNYISTKNLIAMRFILTQRGKGRQNCRIEFEFYMENSELTVSNVEFDIISDNELQSLYKSIREILPNFYEIEDDSDEMSEGQRYPDLDHYFIKLDDIVSVRKCKDEVNEITLINNSDFHISNDSAIDALIRKLTAQNI